MPRRQVQSVRPSDGKEFEPYLLISILHGRRPRKGFSCFGRRFKFELRDGWLRGDAHTFKDYVARSRRNWKAREAQFVS